MADTSLTDLTAADALAAADLFYTVQSGNSRKATGTQMLAFAKLNTLAGFAATTSAELAAVISNETGSGLLVFATSPTLTTPVLGVASATSINKVAITAPATGSTLTIADGKTLTVSNSGTLAGGDAFVLAIAAGKTLTVSNSGTLAGGDAFVLAIAAAKTLTVSNSITLAGTDSTVMTFPATSASIARIDAAQTFVTGQIVNGTLRLGTVSAATGQLLLANSASGELTTIQAGNAAAARTYTWPTDFGAAGTVLTDAGGDGTLSWAAGGGGITIDTTVITGGADTRLLYDNTGEVGETVGLTYASATQTLTITTTATAAASALTLTGQTGVLAASQPLISGTQTWNAAGVTFIGMNLNFTATANAAGSKYFRIQRGGAEVFSIQDNANVHLFNFSASNVVLSSTIYTFLADTSNPVFALAATGFPGTYGISLASNRALGWSSTTTPFATADLMMVRAGAASLQLGSTDAAAPVAQSLRVQSVVAGTANTAGANWTLTGSRSTGTGTAGDIIIVTGVTGTTATTSVNGTATAVTFKGGAGIGLSGSVVLGSAAISTAATDGFLYLPTCAGTPTGTPTDFTGRVAILFDTTNNQFWIYDGAWTQPKTPAGAALVTWQ